MVKIGRITRKDIREALKSADKVYETLRQDYPGLIVEFTYEEWMLA